MFEKYAKEYCNKLIQKEIKVKSIYDIEVLQKDLEKLFQSAAEFGYNEANKWHDLRENPNDLPNDGELVLANNLLHTECVKFGKDKGFGISWKTDYFELSGVVLWKEIKLPEEIGNE